jgi:hypothetical protein
VLSQRRRDAASLGSHLVTATCGLPIRLQEATESSGDPDYAAALARILNKAGLYEEAEAWRSRAGAAAIPIGRSHSRKEISKSVERRDQYCSTSVRGARARDLQRGYNHA